MIYGAKDGFWPLETFAETAYRMPHGRLIIHPDLGHSLITSPKFVADVVAFRQQSGRVQPSRLRPRPLRG